MEKGTFDVEVPVLHATSESSPTASSLNHHGTYNPSNERLVFLAILSPANAPEPGIVDVSTEEPWRSLRNGFLPVT